LIALGGLTAFAAAGDVAIAGDTLSDAQQVIASLQFPPGELHVIGGVGSRSGGGGGGGSGAYRPGDPIALSVEVSRAAYVAVLQVTRAGDTTQVFPSRPHPDGFLAAAAEAPPPPLRISVPAPALPGSDGAGGVVIYEFIAATNGRSWLFHPQPAAGADFTFLGPTTRALAREIRTSLRPGSGSAAAATAFVTVRIAR
jgi:hypothetical protein